MLIIFFSSAAFSQNICTEEQKRKAELFAQTTTENSLKFEIQSGNFGDCIHHEWMDKMRKSGVKTVVAVVSFKWKDGLKKFKINELNFSENYDFSYTKNRRILKAVEKSGLKEDLKEPFAARATLIISAAISNIRKTLNKKDSAAIKGKLYLHLFDDEILPLQQTTSDLEIY